MSQLLIIVACLATGLAIRLLRRLPRLVFIATLVGAMVLAVLLISAPDTSIVLIGRTLTLDLGARALLWLAIGIAVVLAFFGPLAFVPKGKSPAAIIVNAQGAFFFWSLAPIIAAIVFDSFPIAVFLWALGLIVLMLSATPKRGERVGGAAQFLLLTVMATASLLLANQFTTLYPLTPENPELIRNAVVFLALGFGLLLAVVPLHVWIGPLSDEMPPLSVAFLVGVAQPVGLWLLFQQMNQSHWLVDKSPLLNVLMVGGAITAPVGALLALSEKRDGRFIAYLSLISLGHALVGMGLGTRIGLAGALLAVMNRAIGVALLAGGLAFVRHHPERRWQLVGASAIIAGGLALAGIPPMLGLVSDWAIYRELVTVNSSIVLWFVASNVLAMFSVLRTAEAILANRATVVSQETKIVPYLSTIVVILLIAIVFVVGMFPQLIITPLLAELGQASYLK
jgi:formate hydrogenlyase subunit 3/multisubunit Na+/H+ antiporter MnhD subunit